MTDASVSVQQDNHRSFTRHLTDCLPNPVQDKAHPSELHDSHEIFAGLLTERPNLSSASQHRQDTTALVEKHILPSLLLNADKPDKYDSRNPFSHNTEPDLEWLRHREWLVKSPPYPHTITVVPDPAEPGKKVIKFEVQPGDRWAKDKVMSPNDPKERAEISTVQQEPVGSTRSTSFEMYLPKDFPIEDKRLVLAQFWQVEKKSPPVSVRYEGGRLIVAVRFPDPNKPGEYQEKKYYPDGFKLGQWNDFRFKVHWSDKSDGTVEMWLNGKKVVDYKGPDCYPGPDGPIFKFGIYRAKSDFTSKAYFKDVDIDSNNEKSRR